MSNALWILFIDKRKANSLVRFVSQHGWAKPRSRSHVCEYERNPEERSNDNGTDDDDARADVRMRYECDGISSINYRTHLHIATPPSSSSSVRVVIADTSKDPRSLESQIANGARRDADADSRRRPQPTRNKTTTTKRNPPLLSNETNPSPVVRAHTLSRLPSNPKTKPEALN